jgi:transcriptional regulator with XRE-family HTH domain
MSNEEYQISFLTREATMNSTDLRDLLQKTGVSQTEIALRFGVNNTLVSHYVSGLREIPAEFAVNVIHWVHQVAQERARFAADALFRLEEAKEVSEPETLAGVG